MGKPPSARGGNFSAQRVGIKSTLMNTGIKATGGMPPKGASLSALGKKDGIVQGASGYYIVQAKNNDLVPLGFSQKSTQQKTIASGGVGRSVGTLPKIKDFDSVSSSHEIIPRYPGGSFPTLGLNKYRETDMASFPTNPFTRQPDDEKLLVVREVQRDMRRFDRTSKIDQPVYAKMLPHNPDRAGQIKSVQSIEAY